jgi:hypothetical protein
MQQVEKARHVDAVFGGRPVRFELARDVHSLLALENDLGSLSGCLGRFVAGTWLVSDVLTVLSRAHPRPRQGRQPETIVSMMQTVGSVEEATGSIREAVGLPARPSIQQRLPAAPAPTQGINPALLGGILSAAPPTVYAILAARVLEALLYGIEPARVQWDERNPTDEDERQEGAAA